MKDQYDVGGRFLASDADRARLRATGVNSDALIRRMQDEVSLQPLEREIAGSQSAERLMSAADELANGGRQMPMTVSGIFGRAMDIVRSKFGAEREELINRELMPLLLSSDAKTVELLLKRVTESQSEQAALQEIRAIRSSLGSRAVTSQGSNILGVE
jgi:hypothetical protein